MTSHAFTRGIIALTALFYTASHAAAQDDPPSRIARLSYIRGSVSFQPAGTDLWVDAYPNRPLTTGDALWSGSGSRVALHMGSASIGLAENTGFSFLNLSDHVAQLQLNTGTLRLRVKWLGEDDTFEVDTPNLAFSILRPGIYRINVNTAGDTTVIEDIRGEGEVTGGGAAYNLQPQEVGTFYGFDQLTADLEDLNGGDEFESWCEQRDHHEDASVSARYMSDYAIGYDDLDDNGDWRPVPNYGMVWFPHVNVVGWAPYHYGHWAYIDPWGYTWIDDAPWGFAPFHYGRWIAIQGTWAWVPCPPRPPTRAVVYVAPVYAPALVAWVGGPHFSIGISVGAAAVGVAWFPLGPREVYLPSYRVSRNYVNNVNVSNTTVNTTVVNNYYNNVVVNKTVNVTNVTYINQRVPGAVAATTPAAFSSGQPVSRNAVRVDSRELASAPVAAVTPPAVPQQAAVLGGRSPSNVKPPPAVFARPVVAKLQPPPPPPPVTQRLAMIQSNGGRPLSVAQLHEIAPQRTETPMAAKIRIAPAAKPVQLAKGQPVKNGQPASLPNRPAPAQMANRPAPEPAAKQPLPPQTANTPAKPALPPAANVNPTRPPTAYPSNTQLEQQHQQENLNLHKQQDQERQRAAEQQAKELQAEKQKNDAAALRRLEQQHQMQQQALAQKHQQEQLQLQQKQEQEHKEAAAKQDSKEKSGKKPAEPPR